MENLHTDIRVKRVDTIIPEKIECQQIPEAIIPGNQGSFIIIWSS